MLNWEARGKSALGECFTPLRFNPKRPSRRPWHNQLLTAQIFLVLEDWTSGCVYF